MMKSRARWRAWGWAAASAALLWGLGAYAGRVLIPRKVLKIVPELIQARLQRRAQVGAVKVSLLRGLDLQRLVIFDMESSTPLFTAQSVRLRPRWLKSLRTGSLALASVQLEAPELNLRYASGPGWNIPGLLSNAAGAGAGGQRLSLRVVHGTCRLFNEGGTQSRAEDLSAQFSPDGRGGYLFKGAGRMGDAGGSDPFVMAGKAAADGSVHASLESRRLPLSAALAFFQGLPLSVTAQDAGPLSVRLDGEHGLFQLRAHSDLRGLALDGGAWRLHADAAAYARVVAGPGQPAQWAARISLRHGDLSASGVSPELEELAGDVVLNEQGVSSKDLRLLVWGLPLSLSGTMNGYSDPVFDLRVETGHTNLGALAAAIEAGPGGIRLSGPARLSLALRGPARDLLSGLSGRLEFHDAGLKTALLPLPVLGLAGQVDFSAAAARWRKVSLRYGETAYSTSGSVEGPQGLRIRARLSSPDSAFDLRAGIQNGLFRILHLSGTGPSTRIDVAGTVRDTAAGPSFSLRGLLQASAQDAASFLPARQSAFIRKAGLKGVIRLQGSAAGPLRNPAQWTVALAAQAQPLQAYDLRWDSAQCRLALVQGRLSITSATVAGYSGIATAEGIIELSSASFRDARFTVSGLDLERLGRAPPLQGRLPSGLLSLKGRLSGIVGDLGSMTGEAKLKLIHGQFLRFPLLGKAGDIIFGSKYNDTVFSQAAGTLLLEHGVLSSDGLTLRSDPMVLVVSGQVKPGGKLDLLVQSHFNEKLLIPTLNIARYAARVTGGLGLLVAIHVSGSWGAPEYVVLPSLVGWADRFKSAVFGL